MDELIARINKIPMTQRIAGLMGVIVVLILGTYFFYVSPKNDEIATLDNKINRLDSELERMRLRSKRLKQYKVQKDRLVQQLGEALTKLPSEAEIPELLQKLASLVEESDCTMSAFEPQQEISEGFYARIPVKMKLEGNYHSIAVFFDKVSKLTRIVNVTDIKLSSPKVENKKTVLNATFLATTFKFVEQDKNASKKKSTGRSRRR